MATIKEVAKLAGVSICTVSRALSNKGYIKPETKAKILAAVEELHYHPNQIATSLKTGRSKHLALVLPSLNNIYFPKLEKYIESHAHEKGYIVFLSNTEYNLETEKKILEAIPTQNVAGVIITPCNNKHEHIKRLSEYDIPYVYLNRNFDDDPEHCLHIDNEQAAYNAVSYLIECGHRAIGGIFQSFDDMSYKERYDGMLKALKEHKLPVKKNHFAMDLAEDDLEAAIYKIKKILTAASRPDAIFACNDMMAFGVYKAAYELNIRIPDELSVFGYDNCLMADVIAPPLSTFATPAKELSRLSIDFIDHYNRTKELKKLPTLTGELIIRSSVYDKRSKS